MPGDPGERSEPVGSLAEEAAALLAALSGVAREHLSGGEDPGDGEQAGAGRSDPVSAMGETLRSVNQHIATGAAECTWCPLCQVIHAVRATSPEVRAHLAAAAGSLLQAASGLLATQTPPEGRTAPVEKIDLDDQDPGDAPS